VNIWIRGNEAENREDQRLNLLEVEHGKVLQSFILQLINLGGIEVVSHSKTASTIIQIG